MSSFLKFSTRDFTFTPALGDPGRCLSTRVEKPPANSTQFRLCRLYLVSSSYSTQHLKPDTSQRPYVSGWAWPGSNKTLFVGIELGISYHVRGSQNHLLIVFSCLKIELSPLSVRGSQKWVAG